MKLDFAKSTSRIIVAYFIGNGVNTLIKFLRKTLFMWVMGSEYLGLNGLFYSILGVLSLAELGFGRAIVSYMYKTVAEDDHKLLCAYLRFYRKVYTLVGTFIFISGLSLLPFLRKLIHGHIPSDVNLFILYLMLLTNNAIGYFFFAYRGSIFYAHNRNDILSYISTGTRLLEFLASCAVLYFTRNYYFYIIVLICSTLLNNIMVLIASKLFYPDVQPKGNLPKEEVSRIIKDLRAIIMHKIGGVLHYSFDNVIISSFLGLSSVAAYGNYNHLKGSVACVSSAIITSMRGGFGNKIYTNTKDEIFEVLLKANRMVFLSIIWCAAMLLALFQPFMLIWTRGDSTLMRHFLTPLLMVVWFYEQQSRGPICIFKNAAAIWRVDRWKAIIANVINLALNITFIKVLPEGYGLDGVIFATILCDVVIQMPWESYAVFTAFFTWKEAKIYWRKQLFYFVFALLTCALTWCVAYVIPIDGLYGLVVKGCAAATVSAALTATVFYNEIHFVLDKVLSKVR